MIFKYSKKLFSNNVAQNEAPQSAKFDPKQSQKASAASDANSQNLNEENEVISIKCVVVGDGCVGKTSLLHVYTEKRFPEEYEPTVFDNYNVEMIFEGKMVSLGLWDTSGQSEYDGMRHLGYDGTHIFIVCFSVVNKTSYRNVMEKWLPEIKQKCGDVPFILVGTMVDKRLRADPSTCISYKQGAQLSKQTGSIGYVECSAKEVVDVENAFNMAVEHQFVKLFPACAHKNKSFLEKINSLIRSKYLLPRMAA